MPVNLGLKEFSGEPWSSISLIGGRPLQRNGLKTTTIGIAALPTSERFVRNFAVVSQRGDTDQFDIPLEYPVERGSPNMCAVSQRLISRLLMVRLDAVVA